MNNSRRKIAPVVRIRLLHDKQGDADYWRALPVEDRLQALEDIRREYNEWRYGAHPRLERVYSIIKLEQS